MNPLNRQDAVIYARVSSLMQLEGYSLPEQANACEKLIGNRNWNFVRQYTDEGVSARTTDRPAFRQMLADAAAGHFSVIVVHKLDRFSRSVTDMLLTMRELEKRGVSVVSATEDFDFSTPIGRVLLTLLAAFAEWYLNNLSQEMKKGHAGRFAARKQNGAPPYGYVSIEGQAVWHEEQAGIVYQIFLLYAGGRSATEIAERLNTAGITPPGMLKRKDALPFWSKDAIAEMLRNRFYIGEIRHHNQSQLGTHDPIIPMDLWERVEIQRYERSNKAKSAGRPAIHYVYLCARYAYCIQCSYTMRVASRKNSKGNIYAHYTCSGRARQTGCTAKGTNSMVADRELGEYLNSIRIPADWHTQITATAKTQLEQVDDSAAQIKALQKEIKRNKRMLAVAEDDAEADSLTKLINEQQMELKRLQHAAQPVRPAELNQAADLLTNLKSLWKVATDEEKQQLVRAIAHKIWLNEEGLDHVEVKPVFKLLMAA